MTEYKKIANEIYGRCSKCGVFIRKGKLIEHKKTNCDGESGKKEREEISNKVLGVMNKVMKELNW